MADVRRASELRQVELVDAALHIVATRGITALTTRSLAEHVGLSTGAIFRHFASLDALLDAVVERVEAVLDATYPPRDLAPMDRLERFVVARSEAVGGQIGIFRLMLSEQFRLALPRGGSERLAACVQKTRDFVRACIRDGQREGAIRDDIDPSALAVIVTGTVQMLVLSAANAPQRAVDARAVRRALTTLLQVPKAPAKERKHRT